MSVAYKIGSPDPSFTSLIALVSNIVGKISGNKLGEKQSYMIETRVKKRMLELGLNHAKDYEAYIKANFDKESIVLVGLITTHHTYFFREFIHFEILKAKLPELCKEVMKRADKTLKIWSAACSKGHEVFSLAMFLKHHLPEIAPGVKFKILGTDIDPESIKIAQNSVYALNEIKEIPMVYLADNWAYGTGEIANFAKVKKHIKENCEFKTGNLLKIDETVGNEKFDIIFCRNVFIYFEPEQVKTMAMNLVTKMYDHGMFFTGVSEPLSNFKLSLENIGPSAYGHRLLDTPVSEFTVRSYVLPEIKENKILKVFCIDDSSTILSILKKVLTKEQGFEIVGTAINGKDAMEKMKGLSIDLVTLDIHMPEMDGLTYLEKNFNSNHPPVMMISSASREDSDTALKAFKLGASEYVEKPGLNNIEERGEEIRNKLKILSTLKNKKISMSSIDKEAAKKFVIKDADKKLRVIFASLSHIDQISTMFREFTNDQPASVIFVDGAGEALEGIIAQMKYKFFGRVEFLKDAEQKLENGVVYFSSTKDRLDQFTRCHKFKRTSVLMFGHVNEFHKKCLSNFISKEIIVEDFVGVDEHKFKTEAKDIVPVTSFAYLSNKYLSF